MHGTIQSGKTEVVNVELRNGTFLRERAKITWHFFRALIERPYSCESSAVGAVYDRPRFAGHPKCQVILARSLSPPQTKRPFGVMTQ